MSHADTERHFLREGIDVLLNRRVVAVAPGRLTMRHARQASSDEEVPFGLCVWSTGA